MMNNECRMMNLRATGNKIFSMHKRIFKFCICQFFIPHSDFFIYL
jgi:hypothetical protein